MEDHSLTLSKNGIPRSIPGSGDFDLGPLVNINNPNQLVNACQGNYVYKVLDSYGCEFISPVYTIDAAPGQVNITETISNYNGYNIDCFFQIVVYLKSKCLEDLEFLTIL